MASFAKTYEGPACSRKKCMLNEKIVKGSFVEVFGAKKRSTFNGKRGRVREVLENKHTTTTFQVAFDKNGTMREEFDLLHLRRVTSELLRYFNLPVLRKIKIPGGEVDSTMHVEVRTLNVLGKQMGICVWRKYCGEILWSDRMDITKHWASDIISKIRSKLIRTRDGNSDKGDQTAVVPFRPACITCRDPGLLRVLKRGFEGRGTKVRLSFPDEMVQMTGSYETRPLVERADQICYDLFVKPSSSRVGSMPALTQRAPLRVLYDEEIGGYVTEKSHVVPPLSRACVRCGTLLVADLTDTSRAKSISSHCHCDSCPFAFYCSTRCALDDEEDHEDDCEKWAEHVDAAIEVDYESSNASVECADGISLHCSRHLPPFRPATEATIINRTKEYQTFDGYACLADTSHRGGPDGQSYRVKILNPGPYYEVPDDPVWVRAECLKVDTSKCERNPLRDVYARVKAHGEYVRQAVRVNSDTSDERSSCSRSSRHSTFNSCLKRAIELFDKGTEQQDEARNYPAAIRHFQLAIQELIQFDMVFSTVASGDDPCSRDLLRMKRKLAEMLCSKAACHVEIANEHPSRAVLHANNAIDDCCVALRDQSYVPLDADLRVRLEFWLEQAKAIAVRVVQHSETERPTGNSSERPRRRRRRKKNRNGVPIGASESVEDGGASRDEKDASP